MLRKTRSLIEKGKDFINQKGGKNLGMVCGKERGGAGVKTWVFSTNTYGL
jgi:hypothetical protein